MKTMKQFLTEHEQERTRTEIWTRCMGYYRNTDSFNTGKQSEFKERTFFAVKSQIAEMTK